MSERSIHQTLPNHPTNRSTIPIRTEGSKPPFFCLPGNLGSVFTDLGHLAQHLGPDQPFYGLQDSADKPAKIEALATHYLGEIQAVQPEGPFLLGGIDSGGVIAFELARQLRAKGERVALLAMIEAPRPCTPSLGAYLDFGSTVLHRGARRFSHHSSHLSQLTISEQKSYLRLKRKLVANLWALRRYAPRPYAVPLHLFLTRESLRIPNNPQLYWRKFTTGQAEVHEIPGNRDSVTGNNDAKIEEAYMKVLAEKLGHCIDRALEKIRG